MWNILPALALTAMVSVCVAVNIANAADELIVSGPNGIGISTTDLNAEALRLQPQSRRVALGKPGSVGQLAANLYIRRVLAAGAEKAQLLTDPVVNAAMKLAQDRVLSDAMLARLDRTNTPTDAALDQFALTKYKSDPALYRLPEEINARHILVKSTTANAHTKADDLLLELKRGADFETLAKSNSDDAANAASGGDLGFFSRGQMASAFETAAFALTTANNISAVVETEFGFHIIKLIEKKPSGLRPFAEVKDQLRKETLDKLLSDGRDRESVRLLRDAKFDDAAIKAYAELPH